MKRYILSFVCLFLLAAPAQAWEVKYPKAKIYAVEVWAQWCPNCKILDPKIAEAKELGALKEKDVLFVRMDFSDKPSIYQSKMLAVALGLEDFLKENGAGTGYLALVDAASGEELQRFTRDANAEVIAQAIQAQIEAKAE